MDQRLPSRENSLISESLDRSRLQNASYMNRMRFVLATAMAGVYAVGIIGLGEGAFRRTAGHLGVYWAGAGLLWWVATHWRPALNVSRFAVPLIDVPMATWIQHTTIRHTADGRTAAIFTMALFVFLIALSSFSLRARHLLLTLASTLAGLGIVYGAAAMPPISWMAGPLLLVVTAAMMSWFPERQAQLVRDGAERQSRRDRLARYFSPGIAEVIESHDEPAAGETCEISVIFCDIRGFTGLSEKLDAVSVVRILNEFHSLMVEEIFQRGGTLDKYLGDGLLAYFNAPVRQADHAVRAVECALAMTERLAELNRRRMEAGETPLAIGIGIHSGRAVVGNIGAPHRREFTAIGDTVNVSSRLQGLTRDRGVPILASEAVAAAIPGTTAVDFVLEPAGEASVRGRDVGVRLYVPKRQADPASRNAAQATG